MRCLTLVGRTVMRRSKPTRCFLSVLICLWGAVPAANAAPEQYTLGAEVAAPKALPASAGTSGKAAGKGKAAASPAKAPAKAKRTSKVASKSKSRKTADVIATDIPPAKIDLTLPKDMVGQLQPPGQEAAKTATIAATPADGKPLLPSLFTPKDGGEPFQLNGRLLTNEMDLQLRNDSRREVDGAALDFKFKQ